MTMISLVQSMFRGEEPDAELRGRLDLIKPDMAWYVPSGDIHVAPPPALEARSIRLGLS